MTGAAAVFALLTRSSAEEGWGLDCQFPNAKRELRLVAEVKDFLGLAAKK